ncbi:MAG: hypothetical protein ACREU7_15740, partial [Burkholderiales bacterium]
MVQSVTEEFSVVWQDPADASLTWDWDPMHFPRPLAALSAEVIEKMWRTFMGAKTITANGYLYHFNAAPPPPTPEVIERGAVPVWEQEYIPRIAAFCRRIRSADYESMSTAALADSLKQLIDEATDTFN